MSIDEKKTSVRAAVVQAGALPFGSETILTADLYLNDIGRGKFDFDVTGHYSRPDVFQLSVNEAPMKAVQTKT